MYYKLTGGEGGIRIREFRTSKELEEHIQQDEKDCLEPFKFLNSIPDIDDGYFVGVEDEAVLIIKGEIIVPTNKQVVVEREWK